jgi:tetratricopeptide (TPR) repeat protein
MLTDLNKSLSIAKYNHLNLPEQINLNPPQHYYEISYLYSAAGQKLHKATHIDFTPATTTDYVGSFIYHDGLLQSILTPDLSDSKQAEGRVVVDGGNYEYQYFLKDHLGNTRITFNERRTIIQEDSYYPYGMNMAGLSHESGVDLPNKFLYNGKKRAAHYGTTIAGGEDHDPAALNGLITIASASEDLYPVMVRATALSLLANYTDEKAFNTTKLLMTDADPVMRHYAVRNLNPASVEEFIAAFVPMLHDPVKAVRSEAASKLSQLPAQAIDSSWAQVYRETLVEYENSLYYNADFPSGSFNLANLYARIGKPDQAELNYKKAIATDNEFFPAKINLAMLYNAQQQNQKAAQLFREVISEHPEQGEVYYSLGLLLAEMNQLNESAEMLEKAAALIPERSRIFYNLGLIYQYLNNPAKAEKSLLKAVDMEPANQDYIYALVDFYQKSGDQEKVKLWSGKSIPSR